MPRTKRTPDQKAEALRARIAKEDNERLSLRMLIDEDVLENAEMTDEIDALTDDIAFHRMESIVALRMLFKIADLAQIQKDNADLRREADRFLEWRSFLVRCVDWQGFLPKGTIPETSSIQQS